MMHCAIFGFVAPAPAHVIQNNGFIRMTTQEWSYTDMQRSLQGDLISKAIVRTDSVQSFDVDGVSHVTTIFPTQITSLVSEFVDHNVDVRFAQTNGIVAVAAELIPMFVFAYLFLRFLMPILSNQASQMQTLTKMSDKTDSAMQTNVTFADVAGCDESKLELEEIVDFLKDPDRFTTVGARIPKGVLLEGPPGTGKTLLAKAVSGESQCPFISITGSDFVEMFVGLGASRVRRLFAEARRNAPCIVFIDEIDAVGKRRGSNAGNSNDEREQTLNQILSEMDGFKADENVVVIAATNRIDTLDDALVRPGRFDRKVPVLLPDVQGRYELFKVHARNKPIDNVDFHSLARQTIGFSGADIANVMNEACITLARNLEKKSIDTETIEGAIEKFTIGIKKSPRGGMDAKTTELVAYHEAGHAIVGHLVPGFDMVNKISILPRISGVGGFTQFLPSEERLKSNMYTRQYFESQLRVCMGGRAAEEFVYGPDLITTGASSDLQQARSIATRMINLWGFGKDLTPWDGSESPDTRRETEQEVNDLVESAYEDAYDMICTNSELLHRLKKELVSKEVLSVYDLDSIFEIQTGDD